MDLAIHLPRTLIGPGTLSALGGELVALGLCRPLLVTDAGVVRAGLVDRVKEALVNGPTAVVFDGVTENNLFADVDAGAALYRARSCDCLMALGGGSVIDSAKCIAVLASNPGSIADYTMPSDKVIASAAPIIAIPTTAGTGSDADIWAGVHKDSTSRGSGIGSRHILPRVAILDAVLTMTAPPHVTAASGIDALTHCIEGYLAKSDVPFARMIALDGLARGTRFIRRAFADGHDLEARAEMMLTAYAGGVAISLGSGPGHAIALSCSDQGFSHGILSGIGLAATLDLSGSYQPERLSALKAAMGLAEHDSAGEAFAKLMRDLGLPNSLGTLGYQVNSLEVLTDLVHQNIANRFAVYHPSVDEYRSILDASLKAA